MMTSQGGPGVALLLLPVDGAWCGWLPRLCLRFCSGGRATFTTCLQPLVTAIYQVPAGEVRRVVGGRCHGQEIGPARRIGQSWTCHPQDRCAEIVLHVWLRTCACSRSELNPSLALGEE